MSGPKGILSDSDKRYLSSLNPEDEEKWDGDENQKRLRLRKKIQAAIKDFPGIAGLPKREYELILQDLHGDRPGYVDEVTDEKTGDRVTVDWDVDQSIGLEHMLMFIYNACQMEPTLDFESLLEGAIHRGERRWIHHGETDPDTGSKFVEDVNVNIDVTYGERPDVEAIKAKLDRGEKISRAEIGELYIEGELDDFDLSPDDYETELVLRRRGGENRSSQTKGGLEIEFDVDELSTDGHPGEEFKRILRETAEEKEESDPNSEPSSSE